jgi:hypothetical protein
MLVAASLQINLHASTWANVIFGLGYSETDKDRFSFRFMPTPVSRAGVGPDLSSAILHAVHNINKGLAWLVFAVKRPAPCSAVGR